MSRHISSVMDVVEKPKKPWTVLIQVLENGHVQQSQAGNDFKRLVFTDSDGTKMTAIIYSNHLRYFAKLLTQYKRYYISNAIVTRTEARYRISPYPYSWILNNRTLVEELVEPIPTTLSCGFEFTRFGDLHRFADSQSYHNVRAVVLKCFESKEQGSDVVTRRDIVIVNEEKKLLLLTLWNSFDEKEGNSLARMLESGPMIFGMRLKVTTFNCLSLSTRATSGFMINPPVTEDLHMREWYNNNKAELQHLLELKTYKNSDFLLPYPEDEDVISVDTAVASLRTVKTAWIKGKTSFPSQERSCWYTACSNCQKSLDADLTWIMTCPSCRLQSELQAISRLTIVIDDGTASVHATICTPDVEKFIPFTAIDLKDAEEFGTDLHEAIATSIHQKTIVAFIRSYEVTFHGQSEMKVNIVKAYKSDEAHGPNPDPKLVSGEGPSQLTVDPPTRRGKEQLFSPSAKKVLDEIASTVPLSHVKRQLTFSEDDAQSGTISAISKPPTTLLTTDHVTKKKETAAQMVDGIPNKKKSESTGSKPEIAFTAMKKDTPALMFEGSPTKRKTEKANTNIKSKASLLAVKKEVGDNMVEGSPTKKTRESIG